MNGIDKTVSTIFILNQFGNWDSNHLKPHQLIYLYQNMAIDLGFRHRWYGLPYSEDLRDTIRDYESNRENYDNQLKTVKLKKNGEKSISKVRNIINPPHEIPVDKWIELLSATHYVKNVCYDGKKTYEGIPLNLTNTFLLLDKTRQRITRKDPLKKFSLGEFKLGWERLKESGLLDKKHNRAA